VDKKHITVCLYDVLGISNQIMSGNLENVFSLYEELANITNNLSGRPCVDVEPVEGGFIPNSFIQIVDNAYFSDTYVIWTPSFLPLVHVFTDTCMHVFCKALEMGFPLRGCISSGNAIMDNDTHLFVGEPIVEAARGESEQNWCGVAFGDSFKLGLNWDCKMFIPYRKHIKENTSRFLSPFVLDWPRYWRNNNKSDIKIVLDNMNTNKAFSSYYDNALNFYEFSNRHQKWYEKANVSKANSYDDFVEKANNWLDETANG